MRHPHHRDTMASKGINKTFALPRNLPDAMGDQVAQQTFIPSAIIVTEAAARPAQ